jgi:acid phosphatase type 7
MTVIYFLFSLIWTLNLVFSINVPTQIHIALAGKDENENSNGMAISWNTKSKTATSTVKFGTISGLYSIETTGQASSYYENFNHHVVLSNLQADTLYYYIVGDEIDGWSEEYSFRSAPTSSNLRGNFSFFVFGDLGEINGQFTGKYIRSHLNEVKFVWHTGDVSYADDSDTYPGCTNNFCYEQVWDDYLADVQSWATTLPYMVVPGNHEADCHDAFCEADLTLRNQFANFTAYNHRFRMPSQESAGVMNMWYSFNYGNVHFVSVNTETDFSGAPEEHSYTYPCGGFGANLAWLEADLKAATVNRTQHPWILAAGHHPIYSGDAVDTNIQAAIEDLFYQYGVDVYFTGHVHSYERAYPVYQRVVEKTYVNPRATLQLIVGGAGNDEMVEAPALNDPPPSPGPWTAMQDGYYGIGQVTIIDDHQLRFDYIRTGSGEVFDTVVLTRNHSIFIHH